MAEDSEEMFVWGDDFDAILAILEEDEAINQHFTSVIKKVSEKPRSFEQAHTLAAILKSMCASSKSRDIPKTLTKSSPFEVCRPL